MRPARAASVLVTGANGFAGRYVCAELEARGVEAVRLVRREDADGHPGRVVYADLSDPTALEEAVGEAKADRIIHLAGIASPASGDKLAFFRINTFGTVNLLEAVLRSVASGGRMPDKIVLASSANIYGRQPKDVLDEDTCPRPVNAYGCSKYSMERLADGFSDRLPIQILRPFNFTGVGQTTDFLIPKIVDHFRRGSPAIRLGNLDVSRDFSDVRDVARFMCDLLLGNSDVTPVNICSGTFTSLQSIVETCRRISGHDITVEINPDFVRKNEIKMLGGDAARLDSLVTDRSRRSLLSTLEWMLSAEAPS